VKSSTGTCPTARRPVLDLDVNLPNGFSMMFKEVDAETDDEGNILPLD
jgi:hypothetical protein